MHVTHGYLFTFIWFSTAWKVSKYVVIFGPYFPVFGLNTGKYKPGISTYLDTFYAMEYII